jgi:hypothetical protein
MTVAAGAAFASDGPADLSPSAHDARALAARIDEVLATRWAAAGIRPVAVADDGEFLRRVGFDLVGKLPTAAEARDFLDDPRPGKRLALVERLLDGPAYIGRAAELWREVLLPEADTEDQARLVAGSLEAWLRKRVAEEAGYDRIVREILTAPVDADPAVDPGARAEPSPAAYYLAKGRQPENLASGASRVFLGVRLECAQCHNHPFAKWKREEFWEFAAFFAGVQPTTEIRPQTPAERRAAAARRELTIPGTSKVVQASHLDGTEPNWRPRVDPRELLADWMTAPENPYFARAVVNRVWARFFGVGLVEPVDDIESATNPELGDLLDELAREFRAHDYDLKFLIRVVTATRAYNLSSAVAPHESTPPPLFAVMPVRGLSPGQLFDGFARATGNDGGEGRARFLDLFANREERPTEAQTTILQALTLMNGADMARATDPEADGLLGAVAEAPYLDTAGRIEVLYLAALTRRPRPDELEGLVRYVERGETPQARAKALGDVFWAILNGPEFRLNH